jgi:hypothetical protein
MLQMSGSDARRPTAETTMNASGLVVRTWNDAPISRRDSDGFADATAMCQANGKRWNHYQENERTTAYLQALAASLGIPADQLVITTTTGPNHLRGTWVHPRLAVDLARWLSPQFAVWMDGWFLEQLERGQRQPSPAVLYSRAPEARALPGRRRKRSFYRVIQSLEELWPSERTLAREIHWARANGQQCRTGDLERQMSTMWASGTVRNAITRLRDCGLITKRGWGWHLTQAGAALADQYERDMEALDEAA